jgi:hypothetical protein
MDWTFGDLLWSMAVFFFWVIYFWMFIAIFGDIFRRNDLSGWAKAGWVLLILVLPLIGFLAYIVSRPKMTEQDRQLMAAARQREFTANGHSTADEIAKLASLRDEGEISPAEYESLKAQAIA